MNNPFNYSESLWNGWNGNECVYKKDYKTAIKYYNSAVQLYPLEYRYFVNRSYCYDQLCEFELALTDAQVALDLNSNWGKCYFRKAKALKGLNRLQEAQVCLLKVIELEGTQCKEAQNELTSVRKLAALESGVEIDEDVNLSMDMNEAINCIQKEMNENIKIEKNLNDSDDKQCSQVKDSKNPLNGKQKSSNRSENSMIEKSLEVNRNETNIGLHSQRKPIHLNTTGLDREPNVLKKLNDFLLYNSIVLPQNQTENKSSSVESSRSESSEKTHDKSDQKCRTNENKNSKFFGTQSNNSYEPKYRSGYNGRRNGRQNHCMDDIVEIWDDSKRGWPSVRAVSSCGSDSVRRAEPTNPWRFKGLWVSNIKPTEQTRKLLRDILSEFGKITLINVISETRTAFINFDNPESPRIAMSRLQGVHMPNICIENEKLVLKFRPLIDSKNYPSINCASERQLNNECYFWRTTGCSYLRYCKLKHIPANKGVDLQPWMQTMKTKFRRQQHRQ